MVIRLLPICFGWKKSVMGNCLVGLWSTRVVEGKACGLIVSGLIFLVGFLEVEAHTKISQQPGTNLLIRVA